MLRHCYCVVRACVERKKPFKSLAQQTTRFAAPRVLRLCYCVVRACVERKKKLFKSLAQQTTRFSAPRSMLRGVRCPNTKILRESVCCPVCSLSELFVNRSPTVLLMDDYGQFVGKCIAALTVTILNIIFTHSLRRQANSTKHLTRKSCLLVR